MRFCAKLVVLFVVGVVNASVCQRAAAYADWQASIYDSTPRISPEGLSNIGSSVNVVSSVAPPAYIDWQGYYNRGYSKGESTGFNVGYADGRSRGVKEGNVNGRADGYQTGYDTTYQDAYDAAYGPSFEKAWGVGYDDGFATGAPNGYLYGYDAALVELAAWLEQQSSNSSVLNVDNSYSSAGLVLYGDWSGYGITDTTSFGSIMFTMITRSPDPWEGYTPEGYQQKGYDAGYAVGLSNGDTQGYDETYESTYQLAYAPAFDEGLKAGVVQGTRIGDTDGQADGWDDGFAWGDSDGFNIGYGWGYADGWRDIYAGAYDLNSAAAFAVTIPEPTTLLVALSACGLLIARRRSSGGR